MKPRRLLLLGLLVSSAIALPVKAQISPDGTTNTSVTPIDNGIRIDEGNRAGDHLFHSFQEFSVPNSSEAFFNNPNDIVNIFSRVTGGNISNIDGLIRANGEANLFLINPAGIIFGENASLNIGGSFFSSTAESIVFSDDVEFSATDTDNPPLLTINQPLGLNFGNNSGDIAVNSSNLQVNSGETLALFGGNVTITGGQIIAPGANIELGGLTQAGQISFEQLEAISFPESIARGDVTLTNGARVDVRAGGGGNIGVNARNLELSGGELGARSDLFAGIAENSGSTEAQAGDITINTTENITLSQGSRISNRVEESGVGNAGGIDITTANLSLTQGSQINTSTFGQGNAGDITLKAVENISIDGKDQDGFISSTNGVIIEIVLGPILIDGEAEAEFSSGIFSQVRQGAIGNSGNIDITTTNLSLRGGGKVDASILGQGNAGDITIEASETISADGEGQVGFIPSGIFSKVLNTARGNSGDINITTANLFLTRGSEVSATTLGRGDAGNITIEASETISADGESQAGLPSGILSLVLNIAIGNSGNIDITTTNLSLTQGGAVTASTSGQGDAGKVTVNASGNIYADGELRIGFGSGIFSTISETGVGNSGRIDITTTNLSLTQGGRVDAGTYGIGDAEAITIDASGTILIDGKDRAGFGSGILSTVGETGVGNAANIDINTNELSLTNGAEISVQSLGKGNAANLNIRANSLALSERASLFASTPLGTGGNITLQIADNLTLRNNSTISAQAIEDANGGNIDIEADFVIAFPNQNNDIIASAARGTGGNINITTNSIFGLEARSSTPSNNTNDIDASSEFGLDGTVAINELDVNPAEGLEELPTEVIDVTRLIAQSLCQQEDVSEFIVTGKGGIAPSPTQPRDGEIIEVNLVEPATFEEDGTGSRPRARTGEDGEDGEEIVEARGWIINDRGIVELVAHKTSLNGSSPQPKNNQICNGRIKS